MPRYCQTYVYEIRFPEKVFEYVVCNIAVILVISEYVDISQFLWQGMFI